MSSVETGVVLLVGYLLVGFSAKLLGGRRRSKRHEARWADVQRTLRELASDMGGQVSEEPVLPGTPRRYGQARVTSHGLRAVVGVFDAADGADDHKTWIRIACPGDRAWVCQSLRLGSRPSAGADRSTEAAFRRCFAVTPRDAIPAGARIQLMELAARASGIQLEARELLVVAAPDTRTRHISDRLALRALVQQAVAALQLLTTRQGSGDISLPPTKTSMPSSSGPAGGSQCE
jgi:hypothetical protein